MLDSDLKVSIYLSPSRPWQSIRSMAWVAEGMNIWAAYIPDHLMPNTGSQQFSDGDQIHCWSVLPALASTTTRIKIGPLVTPLSMHNPAMLAKMASTTNIISNGRLRLGMGIGWQENEHNLPGIKMLPFKKRRIKFEETFLLVEKLINDSNISVDGTVYKTENLTMNPKFSESKIPVFAGGNGKAIMKFVADNNESAKKIMCGWSFTSKLDLAQSSIDSFETIFQRRASTLSDMSLLSGVIPEHIVPSSKQFTFGGASGMMSFYSEKQIIQNLKQLVDRGLTEIILPDMYGVYEDRTTINIWESIAEIASTI